jgi:hypothetical protein
VIHQSGRQSGSGVLPPGVSLLSPSIYLRTSIQHHGRDMDSNQRTRKRLYSGQRMTRIGLQTSVPQHEYLCHRLTMYSAIPTTSRTRSSIRSPFHISSEDVPRNNRQAQINSLGGHSILGQSILSKDKQVH